MSEEPAIIVENVYKDFKLPHLRKNTVKSVFTGLFDKSGRSRTFEAQHALKDVSFEIKKGEFFGIVGRNGSGKSTLLKMLAGIYQPTKGKIHVDGKLVPFIELGVGFNTELTGRENVYLNGALLGFSKSELDTMYDDIVEFAEIEKFMDQKLKNYSSGMQVRLAFSMAIRADADILLVDEVLAVGDEDFQRKCFSYFKQLKKNKKTVVFVTHDMGAVREYCDRAILINASEIVASGRASEVAKKYSRLFQNESTDPANDQKKLRWGNQRIKYEKAEVGKTKIFEDDKKITLSTVLVAEEDIDNPIAGFMFKDETGKPITGTNTRLKGVELGNVCKGQKIIINWTVPNIFSDGTYSFDAAITESDSITICEWWEDAAQIKIMRTQRVPYTINPDIEIDYHSEKEKETR